MPEPLALLSEGELGNVSGKADSSEQAIKRGPVADRVRVGLNGIDHLFRAILVDRAGGPACDRPDRNCIALLVRRFDPMGR